ncbi:MAG TPA: carboxypeptidase regulatory-like domain-containing protein [Acidobacteriaceae bacterium]
MEAMVWTKNSSASCAIGRQRNNLFSKLAVFALSLTIGTLCASAQTGGQGALEGTVTDSSGAVIPNAAVTATNQASNVSTTRSASSAGLYEITPLIPGIYTVTVTAQGFSAFKQQNIEVNGLNVTGFNARLLVGNTNETVTVTTAPPALNTTNSTLGGTITNDTYESLPNIMNGQQRDPTAFATLEPGAQPGTRAPIMSGTGNFLAEVYLDGIPTTTANQQGDNRTISNSVPVEAVDQLQVVSSGPSAEYQGAGAISFTTKSGGNKYHGTAADFFRNTIFDTWGFTAPAATKQTVVNGVITTVPATKPVEHQNELSLSVGGPIPMTRHKGFFFTNWDQFHNRTGVSPSQFTIPTTLMTQGNFTELGAGTFLYNPLTNSCAGATCTRQPFMGPVNGIPTQNVIPASFLSPISQYEQKFMPAPTIAGIANNFLSGGIPTGFDNHELIFKVDYDLTPAQRVSFVFSHGVRQSVGFGANLPLPYTASDRSDISPTIMVFEHTITVSPTAVNQFKFGFTRFPQPVFAPTFNLAPFRGGPDVGIAGLPVGQASGNFPGSAFSATTAFPKALSPWTENGASDSSHNVVPNAYTLVDNYQWSKGKHSMTFGIETQWLEDNVTSQSTPSGIYTQTWSGLSTANFVGNTLNTTATGYSYADFLLGAVTTGATSVPLFQETGGRYRPVSPYFQDDWKVTPNFTVNLGLRYDYLPPYHEVQDRWSFFNPTAINPLTNSPGLLQYAGNRGSAISCQCRTPVQTYWKNFGPRLGFEWSMDSKTVMHGGFAIASTRAGGVGGRAGDSTGTGQSGFGSNIILNPAINTGITAGPSYFLNNGTSFKTAGVDNANFGGPGYVIPAPVGPSASSLTLGTGNFVDPNTGKYVTPGGAPGYADPYLSGRAPEFEFYNFGLQRAITNSLTIAVNYSGSESHFVAGAGVPGFWSGQIDPAHLALTGSTLATDHATNILNAPATPANIAIAQAADPSIQIPYPGYAAAGNISTTPTIGRMLRPFPQYSSPPSPEWDNIANLTYNALQITLAQREWKGLSYNVNYTYSRNIGDDGTTRSAYFVPAAASSNGLAIAGNNRADRGLTATDTPQVLNIYGLDHLPFGKGHIGGNNFIVRNLVGGWSLSGVFSYASGNPLLVIGSGCTAPSAGTCMPDLTPGMANNIRQNGSWGKGITAANLSAVKYLNSSAFTLPNAFPLPAGAGSKAVAITKIGDAPRSNPNLWSPSHYNLNASVQRTFNLTPERVKFVFQADCFNVANKVTFGGINTTWSPAASSTFGEVTSASGNRDFQFAGRINF